MSEVNMMDINVLNILDTFIIFLYKNNNFTFIKFTYILLIMV